MSDSISTEKVTNEIRVETKESFASSNYDVSNMNVKICQPKSIFMIHAPLSAGKYDEEKDKRGRAFINGLRTMLKIDSENAKLAEAKGMVGMVVRKMYDSQRYKLGKVVDYDEQKEIFKIKYEDEHMEEVTKNELLQLVAPPLMVSEYNNRVKVRKNEEKKKRVATSKALNAPKSRLKSNKSKAKQLKNNGSCDSALHGAYVPLAIREKKKDAYYYY